MNQIIVRRILTCVREIDVLIYATDRVLEKNHSN